VLELQPNYNRSPFLIFSAQAGWSTTELAHIRQPLRTGEIQKDIPIFFSFFVFPHVFDEEMAAQDNSSFEFCDTLAIESANNNCLS